MQSQAPEDGRNVGSWYLKQDQSQDGPMGEGQILTMLNDLSKSELSEAKVRQNSGNWHPAATLIERMRVLEANGFYLLDKDRVAGPFTAEKAYLLLQQDPWKDGLTKVGIHGHWHPASRIRHKLDSVAKAKKAPENPPDNNPLQYTESQSEEASVEAFNRMSDEAMAEIGDDILLALQNDSAVDSEKAFELEPPTGNVPKSTPKPKPVSLGDGPKVPPVPKAIRMGREAVPVYEAQVIRGSDQKNTSSPPVANRTTNVIPQSKPNLNVPAYLRGEVAVNVMPKNADLRLAYSGLAEIYRQQEVAVKREQKFSAAGPVYAICGISMMVISFPIVGFCLIALILAAAGVSDLATRDPTVYYDARAANFNFVTVFLVFAHWAIVASAGWKLANRDDIAYCRFATYVMSVAVIFSFWQTVYELQTVHPLATLVRVGLISVFAVYTIGIAFVVHRPAAAYHFHS
ncbi:MAG: hypothetical protein AAF664_20745 [Planctomycetota bacterium]